MLITEISEQDFRKINLKLWKKTWITTQSGKKLGWVEISANSELDSTIQYLLDQGYETDAQNLKLPITLCIHVNNYNKEDREDYYGGGYFDKYLNMYTSESTYYMWVGIKHLYSNRDYYFDKEDPICRVRKKETFVIYRIHLEPRPFVLRHRKEIISKSEDGREWIEINYDLIEGEWKEVSRARVKRGEQSTIYEPCK